MDDEEDYGSLCTFAATGTKPHFQAIFLCHTCTTNENVNGEQQQQQQQQLMPLCICNNCAEICHEGHDVEYYGEGLAYCDCHTTFINDNDGYKRPNNYTLNKQSCCKLYETSKQIAKKLNIHNDNGGTDLGIIVPTTSTKMKESQFPFLCDIFDVPSLRPCDTFIKQAQELVKHTRETHWVSCRQSYIDSNYEEMCDLEKLAYSIFQRHIIAYDLENIVNNNNMNNNDIGAEWWVQVKETTDEAIDLHYDKDEELASAFDLGSFPTLSTVTYLTEGSFGTNDEGLSISAPPTLVFAHTHEMVDEGPLGQSAFDNVDDDEENVKGKRRANNTPQLMISHAREGKHLCFDGRLLHGASSDILLRQLFHKKDDEKTDSLAQKDGLRVTFLVNIWLSRRPSRVESLQNDIRSKLRSYSIQQDEFLTSPMTTLEMIEKEPNSYFIQDQDGNNDRITLPFVSSDATWIEEEEQKDNGENEKDVSGLVVSLVPPKLEDRSVDTMVVLYDEGFEPSLVHLGDDDNEYSEDEDENDKKP